MALVCHELFGTHRKCKRKRKPQVVSSISNLAFSSGRDLEQIGPDNGFVVGFGGALRAIPTSGGTVLSPDPPTSTEAFALSEEGFLRSYWFQFEVINTTTSQITFIAGAYRQISTNPDTFQALDVTPATIPVAPAGSVVNVQHLNLKIPVHIGDILVFGGAFTSGNGAASVFIKAGAAFLFPTVVST